MSKPILDNLFGSKVRVKLLKFLYRNYPAEFSLRDMSRRIQEKPNDVKKELSALKLIRVVKMAKERWSLNPSFEYFTELRSLMLKSSPQEKEKMTQKISGLGRVRLALISGIFLNDPNTSSQYETPADLFIVGDDIDRKRLRTFLMNLEAEVGSEVKLTLMDKEEFMYRYSMFDRFVRVLLEGPHEKIINKLGV